MTGFGASLCTSQKLDSMQVDRLQEMRHPGFYLSWGGLTFGLLPNWNCGGSLTIRLCCGSWVEGALCTESSVAGGWAVFGSRGTITYCWFSWPDSSVSEETTVGVGANCGVSSWKILAHRSHLDWCKTAFHPLEFLGNCCVGKYCWHARDVRIGCYGCQFCLRCNLNVRILSSFCADSSRETSWSGLCLIVCFTYGWVWACNHLLGEVKHGLQCHSSFCICERLRKSEKTSAFYLWLTSLTDVFMSVLLRRVYSELLFWRSSALFGTLS